MSSALHVRLKDSFTKLRDIWFSRHLRSNAHEREGEDENRAEQREADNKSLKAEYDLQTRDIIHGMWRPIAPDSAHEIHQGGL